MSKTWLKFYTVLFFGVIWALFQVPELKQVLYLVSTFIFMVGTNTFAIMEKERNLKILHTSGIRYSKEYLENDTLTSYRLFTVSFLAIILFGFIWRQAPHSEDATQVIAWMMIVILAKELMVATYTKFGWHHILGSVLILQVLWEWAYALHFTTSSPFLNIFLGVAG